MITRIYQDTPLTELQTVELDKAATHHVVNVLRIKNNDTIIIFNGDGKEYNAEISANGKKIYVNITHLVKSEQPPQSDIHLIQAVSRSDRMDWTLQKSVELGVNRITPIYCERSIKQLDSKRLQKKMLHWQGIIVSACEQSGRCLLPILTKPRNIFEYLNTNTTDNSGVQQQRFLLDPCSEYSLHSSLQNGGVIDILVGPEGGFTTIEIESARVAGFKPVNMGPRILRTETASVVALSIIQTLVGDLGWMIARKGANDGLHMEHKEIDNSILRSTLYYSILPFMLAVMGFSYLLFKVL